MSALLLLSKSVVARTCGQVFVHACTHMCCSYIVCSHTMRAHPGVFYAQMVEACQNEFFVLMFIWSWIIVGFFLLINIFIAIVIDSYINVKEQNNSKVGMHEELSIMFTDWWKSVR